MSPCSRSHKGFTLIELLVVIAIIAVLIALLVPAVQKVREAAARSQCQNNLKQIGLAAHSYHDTYKKLPAGWVVKGGTQPNPGWSWATLILPYIEQAPLYNTINPDVTTPGGATANTNTQTAIAIYRCPSDAGTSLYPINSTLNNFGFSNYVCNRELLGPDVNTVPTNLALHRIMDGSSNTILVGERESAFNIGAVWVRANATSGSFEGRPGRGINVKNPGGTTGTGNAERLCWSSLHTGGANFVLADGSVRFISQSIDADQSADWAAFPAAAGNNTLQNLTHPSDGNTVGNF